MIKRVLDKTRKGMAVEMDLGGRALATSGTGKYYSVLIFGYKLKAYSGGIKALSSSEKNPYHQAWDPRRPLVCLREPGTAHASGLKELLNGISRQKEDCM